VRTHPRIFSIILVVSGFMLAGIGIALDVFVANMNRGASTGIFLILGLLSWSIAIYLAVNSRRLVVDEASNAVRIEWIRFGRVHRFELLPRNEVLDVALDGSPTSSGMVYCVAIGTAKGDIALSSVRTSALGQYVGQQHEIATFLGVPARPI